MVVVFPNLIGKNLVSIGTLGGCVCVLKEVILQMYHRKGWVLSALTRFLQFIENSRESS